MKRITLLAALLAGFTVAIASPTALRLRMSDGTEATYSMADRPTVTFTADNMHIASALLSADYRRSEVSGIDFVEGSATAMKSVTAENTNYRYYGCTFACEGHEIEVYNLGGAVVARGADCVSVEALVPAVYIVKIDNRTFKITKQ